MSRMRAKFQVQNVDVQTSTDGSTVVEHIQFQAVGADNYGPNGENEDNDFARWTPGGNLNISITNPELFDVFVPTEKYYLDFTKAD